jgi:isopentenyl-diphosphate Delta-isomerase
MSEHTPEYDATALAERKRAHLDIVLQGGVEAHQSSFSSYQWPYRAFPEIDLAAVSTVRMLLGKHLTQPLIIGAMTGGAARATAINQNLAEAAESEKVALALGSMRIILEHPDAVSSFKVRDRCPSIPLFTNLGVVQLNKGCGADEINHLMDAVDADAIFLHVNPLQEMMQPEGDTDFSGLLSRLETVVAQVERPIFIKEVGTGIAPDLVRRLVEIGVAGIDISGMGGTSWTMVEGARRADHLGEVFSQVGIPTDEAIIAAAPLMNDSLLLAGGGIRNGLDMAIALSLGADYAVPARALLEPALESAQSVSLVLQEFRYALQVACCVAGISTIDDLGRLSLTKRA